MYFDIISNKQDLQELFALGCFGVDGLESSSCVQSQMSL